MKKGKPECHLIIIAVTAFFSSLSMIAQQYPDPEMLYGSWVFNQSNSVNSMDVNTKQDLLNTPQLQEHIASFYTGRQMFFGEDGYFSIVFPNGMEFIGQWKLQGNNLITVTNGGPTTTQSIYFSNSTSFYLFSPDYADSDAKLLFPRMYFIKN
ncbi:hypothetical protein [Flagellimonas sp.]|uniref:hypothetical protein n=1 Tax=Flagellimonas sp. TaxID=2058762 RepID=UPI003BA937FE